jgi:dTMP kinase
VDSLTPQRIIPGGFLVVLEGIDGAGKSTLLPALAEFCRGEGYECVQSREPTDGPWGRKLRESASTGRLSLRDELDLFLQDRREHVDQKIRPALEAGSVVLLDRYYFSTAAYQGARGADPAAIIAENERFAPPPDLVLLLDLDPRAGLGRVRTRGDQPNEFERESELQRVRDIFRSLSHPSLRIIDASKGAFLVREEALALLAGALKVKNPR